MSEHKDMANTLAETLPPANPQADEDETSLGDILRPLLPRWKLILALTLAGGALGYGGSFLITPVFTARVSFFPPQQQSSASSALASLGALSGLVGAAGLNVSSSSGQQVALLESVTIKDRIIKRFDLQQLYEAKYVVDARNALEGQLRVAVGKKDSLITVEVDDHSPQRAAQMANAFVEELKGLAGTMAMTEAQKRRVFFEQQLAENRERLKKAQLALQKTGFNAGAVKSEPKAAVEAYARVKAELSAAEVKLGAMRSTLADNATEVRQLQATIGGLRAQLSRLETSDNASAGGADYIGALRDFKYEEALFEIFSRQYEMAKLDEAREGALYQVVDAASPPERRSKPKRSVITLIAAVLSGIAICTWLLVSSFRRRDPD